MVKRVGKGQRVVSISPRQSLIKRMNVYFGSETGGEGYPFSSQKNCVVREITDNAVDILRKNGSGGRVRVTFFTDGSVEVYDSGSGIPTGQGVLHDGTRASELYMCLGVLNAGTNYEDVSDSIGTNGVGGSGCCQLSEWFRAEVFKEGKVFCLDWCNGEPGVFDEGGVFSPVSDLTFIDVRKDVRPAAERKLFPTGTRLRFKLDDSLFLSDYPFEVAYIEDVLRGVSFLDGSIVFELIDYNRVGDDGEPFRDEFCYGGGLSNIVDLMVSSPLTGCFSVSNASVYSDKAVKIGSGNDASVELVKKRIEVEAVFCYNNDYDYEVCSFVNSLKTRGNGLHVNVFQDCFTKVMNEKMLSMRGFLSKSDKSAPTFQDYCEGLRLAVSVRVPEPPFTSQTKEALGVSKSLSRELSRLFTASLSEWVNDRRNQDAVRVIAGKVMDAFRLRVRRKEEVALKREQRKLERSSRMPDKLVDCEVNYSPASELFICEGDSALSGLKCCRDSRVMALFPIRGKVLNALKASPKKLLANQEVQDIIRCLDAGVGDSFDLDSARYQKVILAVDSDVDGAAIANLLITLFWELFPDVVLRGQLYRMMSPLYELVISKGEKYYCMSQAEKVALEADLRAKGKRVKQVTRFKGLGETSSDVLFETGVNPRTRSIMRVKVDDVERARAMVELVSGDDSEARKEWIMANPYCPEVVEFEG